MATIDIRIPISTRNMHKLQFKLFTDPPDNFYAYSALNSALFKQRRKTLSIRQHELPPIGNSKLSPLPLQIKSGQVSKTRSPSLKQSVGTDFELPEIPAPKVKRNEGSEDLIKFKTTEVKYVKLKGLNQLLSGIIIKKSNRALL